MLFPSLGGVGGGGGGEVEPFARFGLMVWGFDPWILWRVHRKPSLDHQTTHPNRQSGEADCCRFDGQSQFVPNSIRGLRF